MTHDSDTNKRSGDKAATVIAGAVFALVLYLPGSWVIGLGWRLFKMGAGW